MPAWSPDGTRIAFATDRFTTHLDTLAIGDYRLALIDPATGAVEQVRAFTDGKNINPQWTPDGTRAVLHLRSRRHPEPVPRRRSTRGDVAQITRVGTGMSGITSSSPALSVAVAHRRRGVQRLRGRQVRHLHDLTVPRARPTAPLGRRR